MSQLIPTVAATTTSIAFQSRMYHMCAELKAAWKSSDKVDLDAWAMQAVKYFAGAMSRRLTNVTRLIGRVGGTTYSEVHDAYGAYQDSRFIEHLKLRSNRLSKSAKDLAVASKDTAINLVATLRNQPAEVAPQLLTIVLTSILVSGGTDGDGGIPDLDLEISIGVHRSIFSHSILVGAALEAGFLSLVKLVQLVHNQLPQHHDPLWDTVAHHSTALLDSVNKGASLGLAYHLLVDGLAQPAPYHGLPFSIPIEAHQAIFVANGTAEAIDVQHKSSPLSTQEMEPKANTPNTPDHVRNSHAIMRRTPFDITPAIRKVLTLREAELLTRYGSWLSGLAHGKLTPQTPDQANFVQVTKGNRTPATEYELTWVKYLNLISELNRVST